MALTPVYGEVDDDESLATLHRSIDLGVTFIDTANVYGSGANERLIARLLADRRDEVTLATKFGIVGNPADGRQPAVASGRCRLRPPVHRREPGRLETDVDRPLLHAPPRPHGADRGDGRGDGRTGHGGQGPSSRAVRGDGRRTARRGRGHPIAAVQSEWSIWSRDVEPNVVPAAAELGVGFVPYSPLGRGFLTGTVRSAADLAGGIGLPRRLPRFAGDALDANLAVVDAIRDVADEREATAAQVALAWLRYRADELGVASVPIPGTRRAARVEENLGSLDVALTDDAARDARRGGRRRVGRSLPRPLLDIGRPRIASRTRVGKRPIARRGCGQDGIPGAMIEVTLLGTGSPCSDPNRAGPATLVRAGEQTSWSTAGAACCMRCRGGRSRRRQHRPRCF